MFNPELHPPEAAMTGMGTGSVEVAKPKENLEELKRAAEAQIDSILTTSLRYAVTEDSRLQPAVIAADLKAILATAQSREDFNMRVNDYGSGLKRGTTEFATAYQGASNTWQGIIIRAIDTATTHDSIHAYFKAKRKLN